MNMAGIRRNLKNVAHNYTDSQVKVREATSNDPWGPSSTVMSEIADLSYNVVAFSEIMQMLWKRLNDHGRNWRHVYKALVLLEYLIKTGSEKVADQCKENIFAIQTLKDFQYIEENKDQGMNVREKAKALVSLLKDDERLRNERVRALKAKERFAQSVSAIASDSDLSEEVTQVIPYTDIPNNDETYITSTTRPGEQESFGVRDPRDGPAVPGDKPELESARPQTVGEEELQLQLALAMSKEEADQEEQRKRNDDVRLQMALSQSEEDTGDDLVQGLHPQGTSSRASKQQGTEDTSGMNDLLDINFNPSGVIGGNRSLGSSPQNTSSHDPWGMPAPQAVSPLTVTQPKSDPWGGSPISGPPSRVASPPTTNDPWAPALSRSPVPEVIASDPWAPVSASPVPPPPAAAAYSVNDPWNSVADTGPAISSSQAPDPFAPLSPNGHLDEFSELSTRDKPPQNGIHDEFDLIGSTGSYDINNQPPKSKSPAAFLGNQVHLVNLDNLVSGKQQPTPVMGGVPLLSSTSTSISPPSITTNNNNNNHLITNNNINSINNNPFAVPPMTGNIGMSLSNSAFTGAVSNPFSPVQPPNPFQAAQAPKPTMNQLRTTGVPGVPGNAPMIPPTAASDPWGTPAPSINMTQQDNRDPFFL